MLSTATMAVSMEWSWLLYLCMPLRPTRNRFFDRVDVLAHFGEPLVGAEIGRIGLGHANHGRIADVGRVE